MGDASVPSAPSQRFTLVRIAHLSKSDSRSRRRLSLPGWSMYTPSVLATLEIQGLFDQSTWDRIQLDSGPFEYKTRCRRPRRTSSCWRFIQGPNQSLGARATIRNIDGVLQSMSGSIEPLGSVSRMAGEVSLTGADAWTTTQVLKLAPRVTPRPEASLETPSYRQRARRTPPPIVDCQSMADLLVAQAA